jgi:hypothetical protein
MGIWYCSALDPSSSCMRNLRSSSRLANSSGEKFGGSGIPAWPNQLQITDSIDHGGPTSRGTILIRDAKVLVDKSRTCSSGSLMRPKMGTIRKRMYGNALISSNLMMSVRVSCAQLIPGKLTMHGLDTALSRMYPSGVSDERYHTVNRRLHCLINHHIA